MSKHITISVKHAELGLLRSSRRISALSFLASVDSLIYSSTRFDTAVRSALNSITAYL